MVRVGTRVVCVHVYAVVCVVCACIYNALHLLISRLAGDIIYFVLHSALTALLQISNSVLCLEI